MTTGIAKGTDPSTESVLRDCIAALQRVSSYRLPPGLDRRLLWLSENKEGLTQEEREELLGLVEFAEERTVEKLQAQLALKRFAEIWPDMVSTHP